MRAKEPWQSFGRYVRIPLRLSLIHICLLYNRKKDEVPAEVTELVQKRAEAKKAKDWANADALRARITELGYVVEDTPQGPKVSKA